MTGMLTGRHTGLNRKLERLYVTVSSSGKPGMLKEIYGWCMVWYMVP